MSHGHQICRVLSGDLIYYNIYNYIYIFFFLGGVTWAGVHGVGVVNLSEYLCEYARALPVEH